MGDGITRPHVTAKHVAVISQTRNQISMGFSDHPNSRVVILTPACSFKPWQHGKQWSKPRIIIPDRDVKSKI